MTLKEKFDLVNSFIEDHSVKRVCEILGINRSSIYWIKDKPPSARGIYRQALEKEIKRIHEESNNGCYGSPKVHAVLDQHSWVACHDTVRRYMRRMGLKSAIVKIKKHPKIAKEDQSTRKHPNIIDQDFTTTGINQKWVSDITYIWTLDEGWTYLVTVMDLFSRKIIGHAYGIRMDAELVKKALLSALQTTKLKHLPIIFHTDLGSQYTSTTIEALLENNDLQHSYSKPGYPYDNACIEAFHATIKKEHIYRLGFITFAEMAKEVFAYIEGWYNNRRVHGSIGYLTPNQVHSRNYVS